MERKAGKKQRDPRLVTIAGIAVAALVVLVLTGLLRARVALTEPTYSKNPLTVETTTFQIQDGYQRSVSYLGLVVAGRKANLAFEIPGRIASLPHRQGSPVKAGGVIAYLDTASLKARHRATSAELKQAESELELAHIKSQRQKDLQASGAVSKEAFDETRLRATALTARVEAVNARLASIEIELDKSRLLAPYDGIIADHYVYEGTVINPGAPVVRLIETTRQEAHIGVAPARAAELVPGSTYRLVLRGDSFESELLSVRPDVDPLTRSAIAVFAIPTDIHGLDGEPVTLELQESIPLAGGWVPISALLEGQRGLWTVLKLDMKDEREITVREAVQVIDIQGERAYVMGTLTNGAQIVASGTHRITPGSPVTTRGDN